MDKLKVFFRTFAPAFVLGALAVASIAAVYNIYSADRYDLTTSGSRSFSAEVSSGGDMSVKENGNVNGEVLSLRNTTGGLRLASYTNTLIKSLTPDTTGELIWSSTHNNVCISTGAGSLRIGAYVILSDFATVCYAGY